jgi:chromosome segregation ATPase
MSDHKDRLIAQLKQEAMELRQRERDYKSLQDQLLNLESNFGRLNDEKRRMDDDYKARIDANLVFIANLRNEIDDQKAMLTDKKKQNGDLYLEMERQKESLESLQINISRLKNDLSSAQDLH